MEFEWNEAKRLANLAKHRIDFRDAARVFLGPTVERPSPDPKSGEGRFIAVGDLDGRVIAVVYTWRDDRRRIISVRRARRNEQRDHDAFLARLREPEA